MQADKVLKFLRLSEKSNKQSSELGQYTFEVFKSANKHQIADNLTWTVGKHTVKLGGELSNNKGINKQGGGLTAPALTAKDMDDIKTAMSLQADYVAVSFPKNATDMEMARQL